MIQPENTQGNNELLNDFTSIPAGNYLTAIIVASRIQKWIRRVK
jgi:hypothetical protein